jgi:hypothetical protein
MFCSGKAELSKTTDTMILRIYKGETECLSGEWQIVDTSNRDLRRGQLTVYNCFDSDSCWSGKFTVMAYSGIREYVIGYGSGAGFLGTPVAD